MIYDWSAELLGGNNQHETNMTFNPALKSLPKLPSRIVELILLFANQTMPDSIDLVYHYRTYQSINNS